MTAHYLRQTTWVPQPMGRSGSRGCHPRAATPCQVRHTSLMACWGVHTGRAARRLTQFLLCMHPADATAPLCYLRSSKHSTVQLERHTGCASGPWGVGPYQHQAGSSVRPPTSWQVKVSSVCSQETVHSSALRLDKSCCHRLSGQCSVQGTSRWSHPCIHYWAETHWMAELSIPHAPKEALWLQGFTVTF